MTPPAIPAKLRDIPAIDISHVADKTFYDAISFWKTPLADCGDSRGQTCVPYDQWVTQFQAVKAGS